MQKQGYKPTWRFSPGYGNWPLEIQPQLAKIIKTEMIGLQVTENYLLFPRKSVTAIIGLMPADQDINTKRGCTSCSQKDVHPRKLPEKGDCNANKKGEKRAVTKQQLKPLVLRYEGPTNTIMFHVKHFKI